MSNRATGSLNIKGDVETLLKIIGEACSVQSEEMEFMNYNKSFHFSFPDGTYFKDVTRMYFDHLDLVRSDDIWLITAFIDCDWDFDVEKLTAFSGKYQVYLDAEVTEKEGFEFAHRCGIDKGRLLYFDQKDLGEHSYSKAPWESLMNE